MSLRVAIPLFGAEVAPRFGFSRSLLLADIAEGEVTRRHQVDVTDLCWSERLTLMARQQVRLLVCGGFNRRFLPFAGRLGIQVSWGHCGDVDEVLGGLCSDLQGQDPERRLMMPNQDGTGPRGEGPGTGQGFGRCGGGRGQGHQGGQSSGGI